MSVRAALRAYVLLDAGVTAQLGTRLYTDRAPQGTALPYAVMTETGAEDAHTLAGTIDLPESRIEIACWAATPEDAQAAASAVHARVKNIVHTTIGTPGVRVHLSRRTDRRTEHEDPSDGSDTARSAVVQTYAVRYKEA